MVAIIEAAQDLQKVVVAGCPRLTDAFLFALSRPGDESSSARIAYADGSQSGPCLPESVNALLPRITELGIDSILDSNSNTSSNSTEADPVDDHQPGRRLTELDCSFLPKITDEGLRSILESQPRLKRLRLEGCQSVIGEGFCCKDLAGLVPMRRGLVSIDLSGCPSLAKGACYW